VVKERSALEQRHRLLAGVDQVLVLHALGRPRPDPQHPVLAVQDDLAVLGQMVGHQRRQADAEVDVSALGDVARDARGDLVAVELLHAALLSGAMRTTRFTKMPGVTTTSGSSSPSATVSRTCATVILAAAAMIGPKLRAVMR
jgi:hypothetical protein